MVLSDVICVVLATVDVIWGIWVVVVAAEVIGLGVNVGMGLVVEGIVVVVVVVTIIWVVVVIKTSAFKNSIITSPGVDEKNTFEFYIEKISVLQKNYSFIFYSFE